MEAINERRLEALVEAMGPAGIEWLWVEPSVGLYYLTEIETISIERLTGLLVSKTGQLRLLTPRMLADDFESLAERVDPVTWTDEEGPEKGAASVLADIGRLHVQGSLPVWAFMMLRNARSGIELLVDDRTLTGLRERKDEREIELLTRSSAVTDDVVEWIAGQDVTGMSERELAGRIQARYLELGYRPGEWALVATGANAALAHHLGADVPIARDEPLLTDFGGLIDHYWSDTTRMHFPRDPDPAIEGEYEIVCAAADAAFDAAGPGVPCAEVDRAARAVIEDAGMGDLFVHRTGHGIGLEVHEPPYISGGNPQPLEVGHAFTIEPGIYRPGKWGLRYENVVVIEENGPRSLNQSPRMHRLR